MLFTVAIPTYNNEKTIKQAILSAINQSFEKEYEILVVNNCSTDKTLEILKEFENYIRIINNDKTVTMYENHNICLTNAKGKYIIFCHSDDMLTRDSLKILNSVITDRLYPEKYVVWGRSYFRDFEKSYLQSNAKLNNVLAGERAIVPFCYGGLTPSGTCYSRETFLQLGGFIRSNTKLAPSDMSTMLLLASNGFEFEMIDRLLFERKEATTAIVSQYSETLESVRDTLMELNKRLCKQSWEMAVNNSLNLKNDPIVFHNAVLQIEKNRKLSKYYIKRLIKKPNTILLILLRTSYRNLYKSLLLNLFRRY